MRPPDHGPSDKMGLAFAMHWLPLICTLATQAAGGQAQGSAPMAAPAPVAQARSAQDEPATQLEGVEVLGRRGAALVDPEIEMDGARIDALGAWDIDEVIRRTAEDYGLGDAPLVVVNGRRMADPGVFSGFPPDALVRVEVLPPEAGALYGATDPSRRVVNIILQRRFQSLDGRASLRRPTAGGLSNASVDVRQSTIADTRTRQVGLQASRDTALRAEERGQDRTDEPGGEAVTHRPAGESAAASLALTGELGDWSVSLNAGARALETRSVVLRAGGPVESRNRTHGLTMTGGLNGEAAGWSTQFSLVGLLSQGNQSGLSRSESLQQSISANLAVNRSLFDLPAGPVVASLSGQVSGSRSVSESAGARATFSGRGGDLSGSLSLPLTRRSAGEPGDLPGDITLALGANLSETDAGRGEGLNAALAWTPLPRLRVNGSWSTSTRSLLDQQRFEPEYFGEPIVVFDFLTGESVEVLPILGGNPDLRPPSSDRIFLSASAGPFTAWSLQGSISLQRMEAVDGIGALPDPTPEVEAAFPERFQRDADGRLVSLDRRPINLRSAMTETLTSNLGFTVPLGSDAPRAGASPNLLRIALSHTWQFRNSMTIREGLPQMDRLSGDGGGLPRHAFGVGIDGRRGPWGLNVAARRSDGYRIRRASGRDGPDDLRLAAFSAVDLGLSYQFERDMLARGQGAAPRRGSGLQLELEVDNLFDTRPRARLGDGRPAPGYGHDDQDPIGRTVRLTLKRRF